MCAAISKAKTKTRRSVQDVLSQNRNLPQMLIRHQELAQCEEVGDLVNVEYVIAVLSEEWCLCWQSRPYWLTCY